MESEEAGRGFSISFRGEVISSWSPTQEVVDRPG
jgi:hypothetical protein